MAVSEQAFEALALGDPSGAWELYCGRARQKPAMTAAHNHVTVYLGGQFIQQLDRAQFEVRVNLGHVQHTAANYYIPDVFIIPTALVRPQRSTRDLEVYPTPLPLVVEVWSQSTGDYDAATKLVDYQRRGDREIWLLHPYDRMLTAWRRQADGTYTKSELHGGVVVPIALPNVSIDLDALFD